MKIKFCVAAVALIIVAILAVDLTESISTFDTSALETWCGSGNVRMVGAWEYLKEGDSVVLEDEQGNLWKACYEKTNEEDTFLLWINDNGTSKNLQDDYIVKIWVEARS